MLPRRQGIYKLGAYYHRSQQDDTNTNGGVYFIADQQLSEHLSVFFQLAFSPSSINVHNHYYSLGFNAKGFLGDRKEDELGLAVAYAALDTHSFVGETVVELTYKAVVNENLYIRPDFQYIINPSGTEHPLPNAFVGFLRVGLDF